MIPLHREYSPEFVYFREMALPGPSAVVQVLPKVLLDLGGEARPAQVYPAVTALFPQITPTDLQETIESGANKSTHRIQWARQRLVIDGLMERQPRGLWRLTASGKAKAQASDPAPLSPVVPQGPEEDLLQEPQAPECTPIPIILASRAETLAASLRNAQYLSTSPGEYEKAIVEAFRFLGFDAEHVGGPGDTDIVIEAPLGVGRYALVVDAKTTNRGRIAEGQINWPAISDHRKHRAAEYALVIGPDFAGGNLLTRAEEFRIVLMTTDQLVALLQQHQEAPFTLEDLRPLFEKGSLLESTQLNELRALGKQMVRRWQLLGQIVDQISTWSQLVPAQILAQPTALFTSLLASKDEQLRGLALTEVEQALDVLTSPIVGILRHVSNGREGYVLTTTPDGARRRLSSMGGRFGEVFEASEQSTPGASLAADP